MTRAERPTALAGLVSAEAEEIYQRLRRTGALPAGPESDAVDPHAPAVTELMDLGVVFRPGDDALIRPVDPAAALRILIEARQDEMISFQSRILEGWERLSRLLPSAADGTENGHPDGVRVLTRTEEIVTRAAELYSAPKSRLRGTETGAFPTRSSGGRVRVPPPTAVKDGARYQMIYEIDYQRSADGATIVDRSATAGEEVRLRHRLSIKMLHVDDKVALVAADHTGRGAVLVQTPGILAMLAEWFDLLWDHPITMTYPVGGAESVLNAVQRDVLRLMLAGDDETIARRLRMSVTTVRRHIKAIYRALGVNSRFAAGMAAAKLNWI
jgi:DNA-binding CsgD family transcriptional regulator